MDILGIIPKRQEVKKPYGLDQSFRSQHDHISLYFLSFQKLTTPLTASFPELCLSNQPTNQTLAQIQVLLE